MRLLLLLLLLLLLILCLSLGCNGNKDDADGGGGVDGSGFFDNVEDERACSRVLPKAFSSTLSIL